MRTRFVNRRVRRNEIFAEMNFAEVGAYYYPPLLFQGSKTPLFAKVLSSVLPTYWDD